jgi:hypothetical protein
VADFTPEYSTIPAQETWTFCQNCGAVVILPEVHTRFHEALAAQRRNK